MANYTVNMEVELENGDGGTWSTPIRIDSPALGGDTSGPQAPQRPIEVQIVETGPGTSGDLAIGALTFRVAANDPNVGPNDGDGIEYVDMWVYGPDGREVRYRREQTAGYCIFQGGEPECNVWNFADHDYNWPEGEGIEEGMHRLVAIAKADDGREEKIEKMVEVQY